MDSQTRVGGDCWLHGWKRRRQLQMVCVATIACASVVLHWGNEHAIGWIALALIIAFAAHDLLFTVRREAQTMSNQSWSEAERQRLEQAAMVKERRRRLGTEMFACAAALGLVVPWLHRAPRAADAVALVAFVGLGLMVRLGFGH